MGAPSLYDGGTIGGVLVIRPNGEPVFDASDLGLAMGLTSQPGHRVGPATCFRFLQEEPDFWPSASAALDR